MISNRKGNELVGIEINMNLNLLFVELPTIITTSLNQMECSSDAESSKRANKPNNEIVLVTQQVRLLGKVPLIKTNPDRWTTFEIDPVKKASILAWLHDSPSNSDIPMDKKTSSEYIG